MHLNIYKNSYIVGECNLMIVDIFICLLVVDELRKYDHLIWESS